MNVVVVVDVELVVTGFVLDDVDVIAVLFSKKEMKFNLIYKKAILANKSLQKQESILENEFIWKQTWKCLSLTITQ